MAKLEVFQNGNFSDGRPVFQVEVRMKTVAITLLTLT